MKQEHERAGLPVPLNSRISSAKIKAAGAGAYPPAPVQLPVFEYKGQPVADSRDVAIFAGKDHAHRVQISCEICLALLRISAQIVKEQSAREPDILRAGTEWMAEGDATEQTSEKSQRGGHCDLKKIKEKVKGLQEGIHNRCGNGGKVRLMFQDEADFGRINKPKYCWCKKEGIRPTVPCHHIRGRPIFVS